MPISRWRTDDRRDWIHKQPFYKLVLLINTHKSKEPTERACCVTTIIYSFQDTQKSVHWPTNSMLAGGSRRMASAVASARSCCWSFGAWGKTLGAGNNISSSYPSTVSLSTSMSTVGVLRTSSIVETRTMTACNSQQWFSTQAASDDTRRQPITFVKLNNLNIIYLPLRFYKHLIPTYNLG